MTQCRQNATEGTEGTIPGTATLFSAVPPSKWRPFNNSVIFWLIYFKCGKKVAQGMANDVATVPQHYGAAPGAAAPFPAAPPSKWR